MAEFRKNEIWNELDKYRLLNFEKNYDTKKKCTEIALQELGFLKDELEKELGSYQNRFQYKVIKTEFLPVAASVIFHDYMGKYSEHLGINEDDQFSGFATPPTIFFHIIPQRTETLIFLGWYFLQKENVSERLLSVGNNVVELVNDVLIKSVETWYINPTYFNSFTDMEKKTITDEILYFLPQSRKNSREPKINILKNL